MRTEVKVETYSLKRETAITVVLDTKFHKIVVWHPGPICNMEFLEAYHRNQVLTLSNCDGTYEHTINVLYYDLILPNYIDIEPWQILSLGIVKLDEDIKS